MDRWEIVEGYYWWLSDHHSGQWSREYQRLCKVSGYYRPSPLAHGPKSPYVYNRLCDRAGCEHERLAEE